MPLTEQQRNALPTLRALFNKALVVSGIVESLDQRARQPDPAHLPSDVTVRVEIAPPSPDPHPLLLNTGALKAPEQVPIYFYSLQNDQADAEVADTRIIFFIHGGGNIVGHPTHPPFIQLFAQLLRAVASRAGSTSKCILVAPSYRLATVPENAFPAALQDIVAAYDHVLGKGYEPSNIVIAGDSAGGNNALVLTHLVLQSDRVSPRGVVAIAPGACAFMPGPPSDEVIARASGDTLDPLKNELLAKAYLGETGIAPSDPLVSGPLIPFSASWPRTLILVGTADLLIDASRTLKKRLADKQRPVEYVEYDELPHGFWVVPHVFPGDVQDATSRIAQFILDDAKVDSLVSE